MRITASSLIVLVVATLSVPTARAQFINLYGGPTYSSSTTTGYSNTYLPISPGSTVNNSGTAVGNWYNVSGNNQGYRAVRWDGTGTAATELGNLGIDTSGYTYGQAFAVNDSGTAVGYSNKYASGNSYGSRAVRWDGTGTAATELGNLGIDTSGYTFGQANAVNDSGTAVGYSNKYASGNSYGSRAVRWDGTSTAATELGNLGTDAGGYTFGYASAVNDSGTAVGRSEKYATGTYQGSRAVRWDGTGTAATELGNLGTDTSGYTFGQANAVNDSGTAVGYSTKYVSGNDQGSRAVRWDGTGTAATELGNLGTDTSGYTFGQANAVNDSGTAVGYSYKYVSGNYQGYRAVRWDGTGTAATELGNLGTSTFGFTVSQAYAVNDSGTAVGYSQKYVSGNNQGNRAVAWTTDALALDLNAFIAPGSGWTLTQAADISDTGWISGTGSYDPPGADAAYTRGFVMQLDFDPYTHTGGTYSPGTNLVLDTTTSPMLILAGNAQTSGVHDVTVGNTTMGYLVVKEGSDLANSGASFIGRNAGSQGGVAITGANSKWTMENESLQVGFFGDGMLNVLDGGEVSNTTGSVGREAGSSGQVTVSGTGSKWTNTADLQVGRYGAGTLNVQAGGEVSSVGGLVGDRAGVSSTVTVDGVDSNGGASKWTNTGELYLGNLGIGTLHVQNGGQIKNTNGYIGSLSGSNGTATVTGANSQWVNDGELFVGVHGKGTLKVENGGKVENSIGYIGSYDDSTNNQATVDGLGSQWINHDQLRIGNSGQGTLDVKNGGVVSTTTGFIGVATGSSGTVTVADAGSTWTNSGNMYVGGGVGSPGGTGVLNVGTGGTVEVDGTLKTWGPGTLNINGGTVKATNFDRTVGTVNHNDGTLQIDGGLYSLPTTTLTVQGSNSSNLATLKLSNGATTTAISHVGIGDNASRKGALVVESGATLTNAGYADIGLNVLSTGTATVTGSSSKWTNSQGLFVGGGGDGTLTVSDGGEVSNSYGYIGTHGDSIGQATVTGKNGATSSKWTNSQELYVGWLGDGTLNVSDGGEVSNTFGYIGHLDGSIGEASVMGRSGTTSSKWTNSQHLYVGVKGDGTLNVSDGGEVSNTYGFIGLLPNSVGEATITGSGSKWTNSASLDIGGDGFAAGGTGSLIIADGGLVTATTATIWSTGTLAGDGGTLGANVVNYGTIAPGNSPGLLTIDGNLTSTGTLEFELASLSSFDQLTVTGAVDLGGVIDINLIGGFNPTAGSFQLLNFASLVDNDFTFDFTDAVLGPNRSWNTSSFATNGILSITAVPEPSALGLALAAVCGALRITRRKRYRQ